MGRRRCSSLHLADGDRFIDKLAKDQSGLIMIAPASAVFSCCFGDIRERSELLERRHVSVYDFFK